MPLVIHSQYAFNSGEVSPRFYARGDYSPYEKSVKEALNCTAVSEGPIFRRVGTEYVNTVKKPLETTALIPFIFNNEGDAFVLEFGDQYIRFYKDGALVSSTLEVATNYKADEVLDIDYVQIGNNLYLFHRNHPPALLQRKTNTDWSFGDIFLDPPPTYEAGAFPNADLTPGAKSGTNVTFTTSSNSFLPADINRQIHNLSGNGKAVIRSYTSKTSVNADIIEDFPNTNTISSGDWKLDLSPICKVDPTGVAPGSVITLKCIPFSPPEILNGKFTESAASWQNLSNGTGSIGWNSSRRSLEFNPDGGGNEAIAEQPVTADWVGNFVITFDNTDSIDYKIGTTSGGTQIASGTRSAGIQNEVSFSTNLGIDTVYIRFVDSSSDDNFLDNVFLDPTIDAFKSSDIGRYVHVNGGVAQVNSVPSADSPELLVLKTLNSSEESLSFTVEDKTWTASRGYPAVGTIFQQRLCVGSTNAVPTGIWMSETNIFGGFGRGPDSDDAIQIELSAGEVKWMKPNRDLLVGTSDKEVAVLGSSTGSALTPSNIRQLPRSFRGSDFQTPLSINNETVFIQGGGRKIRTMQYDFTTDGYSGTDLIFRAKHLAENNGGVARIAYSDSPDNIIYAVCRNGNMLAGAYDKEQQVMGWSFYITEGEYEDVVVIPGFDHDEVYFVIKRDIGPDEKRFIERATPQGKGDLSGYSDAYSTFNNPIDILDISNTSPAKVTTRISHGFFNGSQVRISGVNGMTQVNDQIYYVANKTSLTFDLVNISGDPIDARRFDKYTFGGQVEYMVSKVEGIDYLEGKEVSVKVDGNTHPNKVVRNGTVNLDYKGHKIVIGLPYETRVTTLPPQFSFGSGSAFGQRQRRPQVIARIFESSIPELDNLINTKNIIPQEKVNRTEPLYSGYLEYGPVEWSDAANISFVTQDPLPFELQGIFGLVEGNAK